MFGMLLHLLMPAAGAAQAIQGIILTEGAREPVAHASIALITEDGRHLQTTASDTSGRFTLNVKEAGTYALHVRHVAYVEVVTPPFEVPPETVLGVELFMDINVVPLEPLVVTEQASAESMRLQEFYRRAERNRRYGRGRIFMRDDLERIRPTSIQTIMTLVPTQYWAGRQCAPDIYIDGLSLGSGEEAAIALDATTTWDDVVGVEVYRGRSQVPVRYQRTGHECAVVLVWTRPGEGRPASWWRYGLFGGLVFLLFSF